MFSAKLWVGVEKEGTEAEKEKRLFVDGAHLDEITLVLDKYTDISAVYFGHAIDWDTVRSLVNKVRVIVEVSDLSEVPSDLHGVVDVVLRVPNWVTAVKTIRKNKILYLDFDESVVSDWGGKKVYDSDEVII